MDVQHMELFQKQMSLISQSKLSTKYLQHPGLLEAGVD